MNFEEEEVKEGDDPEFTGNPGQSDVEDDFGDDDGVDFAEDEDLEDDEDEEDGGPAADL